MAEQKTKEKVDVEAMQAKAVQQALTDIAGMLKNHPGITSFQLTISHLGSPPKSLFNPSAMWSTAAHSVFLAKIPEPTLNAIDSFKKDNPNLILRVVEVSTYNPSGATELAVVVERKPVEGIVPFKR